MDKSLATFFNNHSKNIFHKHPGMHILIFRQQTKTILFMKL